jgi:hypothetical protein
MKDTSKNEDFNIQNEDQIDNVSFSSDYVHQAQPTFYLIQGLGEVDSENNVPQ